MRKKFRYEVGGKDGGGQSFMVSGEFECGEPFQSVVMEAQRQAYMGLTSGKTEYGKPGAGACRGPYTLDRLLVEAV